MHTLPRLRASLRFVPVIRRCRGRRRIARSRSRRVAFTLLELLMVVAVVAILTAALLPWVESTQHDTLLAAAQSVAIDLSYARSLAVANNSTYTVSFYPSQNRYILEHSGDINALDTLPDTVFRDPKDPPDQHIVSLAKLPAVSGPAQLLGVYGVGSSSHSVTSIEFGPLGETTDTSYSAVLLSVGSGSSRRHAVVLVNPITGLATVHPYYQDLPSGVSAQVLEGIATAED